jgi:predicted glutamine amidotransferase
VTNLLDIIHRIFLIKTHKYFVILKTRHRHKPSEFTYVKCGYAIKCRRKFRRQFSGNTVPTQQSSMNLSRKLGLLDYLLTTNLLENVIVLNEDKLFEIRARLVAYTYNRNHRHLARQTDISKSSIAIATKLLRLWPYKATVVHALQSRDPSNNLFLHRALHLVHDVVPYFILK